MPIARRVGVHAACAPVGRRFRACLSSALPRRRIPWEYLGLLSRAKCSCSSFPFRPRSPRGYLRLVCRLGPLPRVSRAGKLNRIPAAPPAAGSGPHPSPRRSSGSAPRHHSARRSASADAARTRCTRRSSVALSRPPTVLAPRANRAHHRLPTPSPSRQASANASGVRLPNCASPPGAFPRWAVP